MSYKKQFLLIIGCAFLSGCTNKQTNSSRYENDNKFFSGYLNRQFHWSIEDDSTNYILVPETSCPGCVMQSLSNLPKIKKSKIILNQLGYDRLKNEKDFQITGDYVIDSNDEINTMTYAKQCTICVIQTYKKEIYNIFSDTNGAKIALAK